MSELSDHDVQHVVWAARALLERHGFAVRRAGAEHRADPGSRMDSGPEGTHAAVDWISLFRATLVRSLHTGDATLGELAKRHAMSPRTLQRRLAAHDTSLRAEVNRARRDLAASLSESGATNSLIALRLGYSDTRALRRALRRWRTTASAMPRP